MTWATKWRSNEIFMAKAKDKPERTKRFPVHIIRRAIGDLAEPWEFADAPCPPGFPIPGHGSHCDGSGVRIRAPRAAPVWVSTSTSISRCAVKPIISRRKSGSAVILFSSSSLRSMFGCADLLQPHHHEGR